MQNKVFSTNKTLNAGGRLIHLDPPKLMGILNVTPDSFYDGGRYYSDKSMLLQAEKMINEGADFIDVGGYSSRPGAENITMEEEISRTIPVIQLLTQHFPDTVISIDTFRAEVVRQAVESGAAMVNDISGGSLDDHMWEMVSHYRIPYVLMHMKGTPQTMAKLAGYKDVVKEVTDYFHQRIEALKGFGIADIVIDPGFGFAKTIDQNFELLSNLDLLQMLDKPILAGLSRKSLVWKTLETDPENALNGTTVLNTVALLKGASILRIHDVKEAAEAIKLINFVR